MTPVKQEPSYFSQQVTDTRRWFLALPKAGERGLITVSVGCERCLPDYVVEREDFKLHCIEFVAEGEGTLHLGGTRYSLQPGSVFSYGPGIRHRIENTSERPMLKYFLDCGGARATAAFRSSKIGGGKSANVLDVQETVELFELLIRNAMNETSYSQRICASLVETLLHKISEQTTFGQASEARAWVTCQRVKQYMQGNFLTAKSMADIAKANHVNPAYLSRLFQRFHQTSPYRYLVRLKMSHAASLLLNPNALVKQVAAELDFSDAFHFSRSFKSVYGVSPEKFMQRGKP